MKSLVLLLIFLICFGCKPIAEEDASLSALKKKTATIDKKRDAKNVVQNLIAIPDNHPDTLAPTIQGAGLSWKLSNFWKVEETKIKNLSPHLFVDSTSLFFSSRNNPRTSAAVEQKMEALQESDWKKITPAEAVKEGATSLNSEAKIAAYKKTLKVLRKKEKMRVATNLEVSTQNLEITGSYWIDAYVLGRRMYAKTPRTYQIIAKGGVSLDSDNKIVRPTASIEGYAFGKAFSSKEIKKTFTYNFPIPPLFDASVPVYGLPALSIDIKIGISARASIVFGVTARQAGSMSLTISPTVGIDVAVGPGATIGPVTASIEATLIIFEAAWPVSVTVGGSVRDKFYFGGVTYDGQELRGLRGALVVILAVAPPLVLKPFFFAVQILGPLIGVNAYTTSWEWEHEIWAAKYAFLLKKGTGTTAVSYLKVSDTSDCAKVRADIDRHITDAKGPGATGDAYYTHMRNGLIGMLEQIKEKKCP